MPVKNEPECPARRLELSGVDEGIKKARQEKAIQELK